MKLIRFLGIREVRIRYLSRPARISIAILFMVVILLPWGSRLLQNPKVSVSRVSIISGTLKSVDIDRLILSGEKGNSPTHLVISRESSLVVAKTMLERGRFDATIDATSSKIVIYVKAGNEPLANSLQNMLSNQTELEYLVHAGINLESFSTYIANLRPEVVRIPDKKTVAGGKLAEAFAVLTLLYSLIVFSGTALITGLVEEKSSKILEIILTSVSPRKLLTGKVLGISIFSFIQFILLIVAGLVSSRLAGILQLRGFSFLSVVHIVIWFAPAVIFYSYLFIGFGATISRMSDIGIVQMPLMLMVMSNLYVGIFALFNPNANWIRILSFVPPFSFFIEPSRVIVGNLSLLEELISLGLAVCATVCLGLLVGKIFDLSLLNQGNGRNTWRRMIRFNLH